MLTSFKRKPITSAMPRKTSTAVSIHAKLGTKWCGKYQLRTPTYAVNLEKLPPRYVWRARRPEDAKTIGHRVKKRQSKSESQSQRSIITHFRLLSRRRAGVDTAPYRLVHYQVMA